MEPFGLICMCDRIMVIGINGGFSMTKEQCLATLRLGVIAGAAGGLAEVAWVTLYSGLVGGDPAILARGVTTAAGVTALLPLSAATLGVAVHMTLAITLGIVLAFTWRTFSGKSSSAAPYPFMIAALATVWAFNFLIVLPIVSPAFLTLVSYPVSLASKLLFGVAAAEVVRRQALAASRSPRESFVNRMS